MNFNELENRFYLLLREYFLVETATVIARRLRTMAETLYSSPVNVPPTSGSRFGEPRESTNSLE